jgi:DNA polymerase I-like protein with 3'-5' exonuclease and polymerase domains
MILLEFDLSGAEWVIVAYKSNDTNMIGVVTSGKSPHVVTGSLISGVPEDLVEKENKIVGSKTDPIIIDQLREKELPELFDIKGAFLPRTMSIRQAGKKSNHGLNYGMKYRLFALTNEIPEKDAIIMCDAYSDVAYPGVKDYWKGTIEQLRKDRTLTNCFGRKVKLLGEWGNDLFMQAFSYVPQSTVVDIVNEAMCLVYENEDPLFINTELMAQVHDSLVLQYPLPQNAKEWEDLTAFALRVKEYMRPELEYSGHKFRLKSDMKLGLSWGRMSEVKELTPDAIETSYSSVVQKEASSPEVSGEVAEAA